MVLSLVTWFTFRQSSAKMDKTKVNKLAVKLWLTTVIFFFFFESHWRVTGVLLTKAKDDQEIFSFLMDTKTY